MNKSTEILNQIDTMVVDTTAVNATDAVIMPTRKVDALGRGYGTGRAKNDAIARVWVSFANTPVKKKAAKTETTETEIGKPGVNIKVNGQDMAEYFRRESLYATILKPIYSLKDLPAGTIFNVECTVEGSGIASQAKALALGLSRGLLVLNISFKEALRAAGQLTRGTIGKERKKFGQFGARAGLTYKSR